ncbi:transmembrane protein, putative (macronuclear) [Tetrahymena thermophila SB210]|uniref:Transmembrane protein, putative n=1 Tax=Tetrahymena thermophila (strain SB210) TaxID=312017 RepID=W7X3N3_TETTS|nr:transmembrane protein, putative [Tetrahymena thermophila SB210]EWS73920.1 transmembrane protein, putative [Tetrahymena thermophila SB210]|eukprot:XP_012653542.1 transmembrane protein, putative [Tetrahymena thermophila SB210]
MTKQLRRLDYCIDFTFQTKRYHKISKFFAINTRRSQKQEKTFIIPEINSDNIQNFNQFNYKQILSFIFQIYQQFTCKLIDCIFSIYFCCFFCFTIKLFANKETIFVIYFIFFCFQFQFTIFFRIKNNKNNFKIKQNKMNFIEKFKKYSNRFYFYSQKIRKKIFIQVKGKYFVQCSFFISSYYYSLCIFIFKFNFQFLFSQLIRQCFQFFSYLNQSIYLCNCIFINQLVSCLLLS